MRVEPIKKDRLLEYMHVAAVAFTLDKQYIDQLGELIKKGDDELDAWIAINDDDKIVAGMSLLPYETRLGNKWVKLCGIGGVASLPEFRRTGAVRESFSVCFEYMRRQGYVLSGLYPFLHAFYRKFGYELCYTPTTYTIPLDELFNFPQPARVRMVDDQKDIAEAREVYSLFAARYNLAMKRDDKQWMHTWGGDAYNERCYRYIIYNDADTACAYVSFKPEDQDGANVLAMRELAYTDANALRMTLGYLSRFYPHYRKARITFPGDVNFPAFAENPYEVSSSINASYMMRILDVSAAVGAMRFPEEEGSFVMEVTDDFLPDNAGRYRVSFADEVGNIERCNDTAPADMKLDVKTLAQLVTGFTDIAGASYRADFELLTSNPSPARLFKIRPQYCHDHY